MVPILEIAKELEAELRALLPAATVQRTYQLTRDREDIDGTLVLIVPTAELMTVDHHSGNQRDYSIQLLIICPVSGKTVAEVDAGLEIVEAIKSLFDTGGPMRVKTVGGADWLAIENDPLWDQERLQDADQVHSLLTLTYRGYT